MKGIYKGLELEGTVIEWRELLGEDGPARITVLNPKTGEIRTEERLPAPPPLVVYKDHPKRKGMNCRWSKWGYTDKRIFLYTEALGVAGVAQKMRDLAASHGFKPNKAAIRGRISTALRRAKS